MHSNWFCVLHNEDWARRICVVAQPHFRRCSGIRWHYPAFDGANAARIAHMWEFSPPMPIRVSPIHLRRTVLLFYSLKLNFLDLNSNQTNCSDRIFRPNALVWASWSVWSSSKTGLNLMDIVPIGRIICPSGLLPKTALAVYYYVSKIEAIPLAKLEIP